MSNATIETYQADIGNFMAAKAALGLPGVANDVDSNIADHAKCRLYIVENYPSVKLPAFTIHRDFYILALTALNAKNELEMEKAPEPGYRMGQLFAEDEDETRELQPLPESPADPWQQSKIKEDRQKSAEESFRKYGRVLNPTELLQAERLEAFQSTAGKFDEGITVHKIINGRDYVDRTATAKARAEARSKNEAARGGK